MRTLIFAVLFVCPALALAQPADDQPAEPPAPPTCKARRLEIARRAQTIDDLQERGRVLASMPDCSNEPDVAPPVPATAIAIATVPEQPRERGTTFEISAGAAILVGGTGSQFVHGLAGVNMGIGRFVTPQVALSLRVAGITEAENALFYLGMIGPHAQVWLGDQAWIGAGVGLGFIAGCADGCDAGTLTTSYDLRAGVALSNGATTSGANLSIELVGVPIGTISLTSISLLLGAQTF